MQGPRFVSAKAFSSIKSNQQGLAVLANPEFCPYGTMQPMPELTTNKDFRQWLHLKTELCRKPVKHRGWFDCSYVHDATELQKPKCLYFALAKSCSQGSHCKYQHVALPDQFLVPRPNYFTLLPKQLIEMILLYALHKPIPVLCRQKRSSKLPSTYITCLTICKRWLHVLSADKFENGQLDLPMELKIKKTAHFTMLEEAKIALYRKYQHCYDQIKSKWSYFPRCLTLVKDKLEPEVATINDVKFDDLDISYKDITSVKYHKIEKLYQQITCVIIHAHQYHHQKLVDQVRRNTSFPCPYTDAPDHYYSDETCIVKPGHEHSSICHNPVRWVIPRSFDYYGNVSLDDTEPQGYIGTV